MQQHLFGESNSGFLDEISIIFIDKTDLKDPKKWEHYSRRTLQAMAFQDLNVEMDRRIHAFFP